MNHKTTTQQNARVELEEVLDRLETPVVEWNAEGTIIYANRHFHELCSWPNGELLGLPFYTTVFPDGLSDQWDQARLKFVQSKPVVDFVTILRDKRDKEHTVLWTTVLKTGETGRLRSVVGFGLEISDLAATMKGLKQFTRVLKNTYGVISIA